MQDKVVRGDQKDGLRGLTRFSDNEGDIIWPAWRAELKQRVAFEFGKIGNQIIEGEVKESDVDSGEVTEKINASNASGGELSRRLQYSPSNRRHEAAHDVLGIVTASEYGSRCAHMYDL